MKKVLIDGMINEFDSSMISDDLNFLKNVKADVDLEKGIAKIRGKIDNNIIKSIVADNGCTVIDIIEL